jgi:hypothetical protein
MKIRFFGFSNPINGKPSEWDYVKTFASDEEAGEAVVDYVCAHDDPDSGPAHFERVEG